MKCITTFVLSLFFLSSYAAENGYQKLSHGDFIGAIDTFQRNYQSEPKNYESIVMLARIHSWIKEYTKSLSWYEKAIALKPNEINAYVELARVTFWMGKNNESIQAYKRAIQVKPEKWIIKEMEGLQELLAGNIKSSIINYDASVQENNKNEDALLMIGALYEGMTFYHYAIPYFQKMVAINPYNQNAKERLEKNKRRSLGYKISSGIWGWYGRSNEQMTNVNTTSPFFSISKSLSDKLSLQLKYSHGIHHYSRKRLYDNTATAALNYKKPLTYELGGNFGLTKQEKSHRERNNFFLYSNWNYAGSGLLHVSLSKENLINNLEVQEKNINSRSISEKVEQRVWKKYLRFFESIKWSSISDNNESTFINLGMDLSLKESRHIPYISMAKEWWIYKKRSPLYYSPSTYQFVTMVLGIRNNESPLIKYDGNLKLMYDSNAEAAWKSEIICSYDFSKQFVINAKIATTNSNYYNDSSFDLGITYFTD